MFKTDDLVEFYYKGETRRARLGEKFAPGLFFVNIRVVKENGDEFDKTIKVSVENLTKVED